MRTNASGRRDFNVDSKPVDSKPNRGRVATFVAMLFVQALGVSFAVQAADSVRPRYSAAKELREDSTLRAIAFRDASFGVAVGDRGTILKTENGGLTWSLTESHVDCELSDVVWVNNKRVVAVGGGYDTITRLSRGAVVVSDDAGKTWRRVADQELSRMHRVSFDSDRRLLVTAGDWSSVSMSVHHASRDGGSTWSADDELYDTATEIHEPSSAELRQWVASIGASAPIRGACHPSEQLYWAVGDHGCIYHSDDGGKRWTTQRGEGRRTSVLVVASNAESVPWSLVGNECLELGNRVSVLLLDPRSLSKTNATEPRGIDLARQAAIALGASGVDVSLPSETSHIIAAHRPSVLVIDDSLSPSIREMLSQSAIESAVQRVAVVSQDGGGGETRLHRSAMLPRSGVLAGDFSQDALNLVAPGATAAGSLSLRRTYDAVGASLRGESVTSGMTLPRSCRLEGERPQASRRQLQIIQARLSEPRRIEQVISTGANETNLASGINSLIEQSSSDDRLRVAFAVYCDAVKTGNAPLQRVILRTIASHDEFGSAAALAQLRLDAIESSQEWKKLEQNNSFAGAGLVAVDSNSDALLNSTATPETVAISPFQAQGSQLADMQFDSSRVVTASATSPIVVPDTTPEIATPIATASIRNLHLPQGRVASTKQVANVDLAWEFHPLVLVARDTFRRQSSVDQLQSVVETNGNLDRLSQSNLAAQWSRLAKSNTQAESLVARAATIPPRLDGALTDDCWKGPGTIVNQVEVRLAYDTQFLYVAIQAQSEQLRQVTLPAGTTASIRDNDLTLVDRLAISLDVDRDLMTAFRLQTTVNRLTSDTIDGQTQWQPTWYVATSNPHSTNNSPTVVFETAILLSDLVASPLTPGESWLCEVKCLSAGTASTVGTMTDPSGWIRFVFE